MLSQLSSQQPKQSIPTEDSDIEEPVQTSFGFEESEEELSSEEELDSEEEEKFDTETESETCSTVTNEDDNTPTWYLAQAYFSLGTGHEVRKGLSIKTRSKK